MKKRILAFLLILAMLLASSLAFAEEEDNWWNILLLGGDSRNIEAFERTDAITILSVNKESSEIKLTSILRDTWVKIPGRKNNKINAAQVFGGPELTVQTVSENFGIRIDNYVMVNMYDFVHIIDLVGGVDVEVSESERKYINEYTHNYVSTIHSYSGDTYLDETGMVHLNGALACAHCRDRYTDSDYGRVMRQQKILLTLAKKVQQMDAAALAQLILDIGGYIETDLLMEDLQTLAEIGMQVNLDEAGQFRIPADGAFESGTFSGIWMIRPNLEKNVRLLHDFIYGEAEQ